MAMVEVKMPEEFLTKLSKLGSKTDEIIPKVLEAGGEVVLEKVRSNLASVVGTVSNSRSMGELVNSLGLSPAKQDHDGEWNIKVGFNEPRRVQSKAVSSTSKKRYTKSRSYYVQTNAMIANVLEYGRSGQPPKPFLRPAKTQSKKASIEAMKSKFESEVEGI